MIDDFRKREAVLTGTYPGPTLGVRYPGDDGSEPEDVRDSKAEEYAERVRERANIEPNNALLKHLKRRNRWAFFTEPRLSLIGAMIYVLIGLLIGSFL